VIKSINIARNIPIPMRDGTILRADIYRPDDENKYPAIVIRTPYGKSFYERSGDYFATNDAAFRGYAVIVQDVRGRFASDGEWVDNLTVEEAQKMPEGRDGYDTIEWAAAQPWCDGNVGMTGGSYLSNVQWQAAILNPPHLKAISPSISGGSPLVTEVRLSGGMDLDLIVSWLAMMGVEMVGKMEKQGKDVTNIRPMLEKLLYNPEEAYNFLPLRDAPYFKIDGLAERFTKWMATDSTLEALPSIESLCWPYEKVTIPCLHVGCWFDIYAGGTLSNYLGMVTKGGSKYSRDSQHLMVGPWTHGKNLTAFTGAVHFGPQASGAASLLHETHMSFFDKYLKGIDVPLPKVKFFTMGKDQWENADTWPPSTIKGRRLFLHSKGQANTAFGDGKLGWKEPGTEPPDTFIYDPHNPVLTLGGRTLPTGRLVPGPFDHSSIEHRQDILCYSTLPLGEDLEITGPLVLHLFASTSAKDTDFMTKLIDVYPDGRAFNLAEGFIRARYRKSILHAEMVNPGEINEYIIDMVATSCLFRKGHSIRIEITSSNFPRVDRNMNTGNMFGQDTKGIAATQNVYHQSGCSSYIDLPVNNAHIK